jgi:hypothetical protein
MIPSYENNDSSVTRINFPFCILLEAILESTRSSITILGSVFFFKKKCTERHGTHYEEAGEYNETAKMFRNLSYLLTWPKRQVTTRRHEVSNVRSERDRVTLICKPHEEFNISA